MGFNTKDMFPRRFLTADDVGDGVEINVTITAAKVETVGDEQKPVVYTSFSPKGIVLNKTNSNNLEAQYGPESDGWIGKPMLLTTRWTDFAGKSMLGLRLYAPKPQPRRAHAPPQPGLDGDGSPPATSPDDYGADPDDDIPFD